MINHNATDELTRTERLAAEAFDRWPPGRAMVNAHIRQLIAIQESIMPERIQEKTQGRKNAEIFDIGIMELEIRSIRQMQKRCRDYASLMRSDEGRDALDSVVAMLTDIITDVLKPAIYELDPYWMEDK